MFVFNYKLNLGKKHVQLKVNFLFVKSVKSAAPEIFIHHSFLTH